MWRAWVSNGWLDDPQSVWTDATTSTTVHKYGLFRFRTGSASCPATPTHSYRLRPSMLNLDSISRNLFGNGSVSSRSDSMSTSRRSKSITSRNSTIEDFCFSSETASTRASSLIESASSSLGHSKPTHRHSASLSAVEEKDAVARPFINFGNNGSEVDLDMQLNIARQNSIDAATAMSRRQEEQIRSGKYPSRDKSNLFLADHVSPAVAGDPERRGPLRVINKTPSPQAVAEPPPTRRERDLPPRPPSSMSMEPVQPLRLTRSRSTSPQRLIHSAMESADVISPRATPDSIAGPEQSWERPRSGYLERFPIPANNSVTRTTGSPASLGSSHTKLRVVSGNGRRVSATRETAPLKETADDAPSRGSPLGYKRMRSQEEITPRKRSHDRAPMRVRGKTEPPADTAGAFNVEPQPSRNVSDADLTRQLRQASYATASTETTVHATDSAHSGSTATVRAYSLREQVSRPEKVRNCFPLNVS